MFANMSNYAVIRGAGKLFSVHTGDAIKVDGEIKEGKNIDGAFEVLLFDDGKTILIGQPVLKNILIKFKLVKIFKDKKVSVAKFKPKARYRLNRGHRQTVSELLIEKIDFKKSD